MVELQEITYIEMMELEAMGGYGFHGSPIPPERLDNHYGEPEGSLVPLHAPQNYNQSTGLLMTRDPDRLARVSFYDLLAPAAARGLFHVDNHHTLPRVDCLSSFDLDDDGLHLGATEALLEDTASRGPELKATAYAMPLKTLIRSPDQPHDFWSALPVQPEYFTRLDSTYLEHLASLCVGGKINTIPPLQPGFNGC